MFRTRIIVAVNSTRAAVAINRLHRARHTECLRGERSFFREARTAAASVTRAMPLAPFAW
jgi:hypothetical protein